MRWWFLLLCGCGRLGFDAAPDGGGGTGGEPTPIDASPPTAGLVLHYPMDVLAGLTTPDASGSNRTATCTLNNCPGMRASPHGGALHFDGTNDFMITPATGLSLDRGTVALWFQLDTYPQAGGYVELFQKGYTGSFDSSFEAGLVETNRLFGCGGSTIDPMHYAETSWPSLGSWHHMACVWDDTTVRLYVDGTERSSHAFDLIHDARPLTIGANNDDDVLGGYLEGSVDEFRIYDRPLTATEIAALADS